MSTPRNTRSISRAAKTVPLSSTPINSSSTCSFLKIIHSLACTNCRDFLDVTIGNRKSKKKQRQLCK